MTDPARELLEVLDYLHHRFWVVVRDYERLRHVIGAEEQSLLLIAEQRLLSKYIGIVRRVLDDPLAEDLDLLPDD